MTAHNVKGEFAFSCDQCSESITPNGQTSFGEAWAEARAAGWRAEKLQWGEWEHFCPVCVEKVS